jgi:hypothetical protein
MELSFTLYGQRGRVIVSAARTLAPEILGAHKGALDLANCTATVEFSGRGYLQLFGWVQLVCSTDNAFHGRAFEMDPFDPFGLEKKAPRPYCWFGITPTLFDAPSRGSRRPLDWLAHSFLAASPMSGERRIVTPLLGFAWGFQVAGERQVELKPLLPLTAADWEAHLPYLRRCYPQWQFKEMTAPGL